MFGKKGN
jgi:hypothetical protein